VIGCALLIAEFPVDWLKNAPMSLLTILPVARSQYGITQWKHFRGSTGSIEQRLPVLTCDVLSRLIGKSPETGAGPLCPVKASIHT
jgi:hypothetical protein